MKTGWAGLMNSASFFENQPSSTCCVSMKDEIRTERGEERKGGTKSRSMERERGKKKKKQEWNGSRFRVILHDSRTNDVLLLSRDRPRRLLRDKVVPGISLSNLFQLLIHRNAGRSQDSWDVRTHSEEFPSSSLHSLFRKGNRLRNVMNIYTRDDFYGYISIQ